MTEATDLDLPSRRANVAALRAKATTADERWICDEFVRLFDVIDATRTALAAKERAWLLIDDHAPVNEPLLLWWGGRMVSGRRVKTYPYERSCFLPDNLTLDGQPTHYMARPDVPDGEDR